MPFSMRGPIGATLSVPSGEIEVTMPSRIMARSLPQGAEQALGLVPGFLVFALGLRIGHDTAADGEGQPSLAVCEGADEQVGVHGAVEAEVAQRAAIRS